MSCRARDQEERRDAPLLEEPPRQSVVCRSRPARGPAQESGARLKGTNRYLLVRLLQVMAHNFQITESPRSMGTAAALMTITVRLLVGTWYLDARDVRGEELDAVPDEVPACSGTFRGAAVGRRDRQ